jgi:DNA-binding NtrC family response regulator
MHTPKERTKDIGDFPTVLLVELEDPVRSTLLQGLQKEGVHVLEARDWAATFNLIRSHSRPIHLLLTNARSARPDLAKTLEPYRPELRVLFVAQHPSEILPNVLHPEIALAKIRELFKLR